MAKQKMPIITEKQPQSSDNDFLSLDLLGGSGPQPAPVNASLLEGGQGQLSFEEMLGGVNLNNDGAKQSQSNTNFLI